jgi:hypothetical protein
MSEDFFSFLEERSHGGQVGGNVVLESFDDILSSFSFLCLFFILGELFSAPDVLDPQGFFLVFELELYYYYLMFIPRCLPMPQWRLRWWTYIRRWNLPKIVFCLSISYVRLISEHISFLNIYYYYYYTLKLFFDDTNYYLIELNKSKILMIDLLSTFEANWVNAAINGLNNACFPSANLAYTFSNLDFN